MNSKTLKLTIVVVCILAAAGGISVWSRNKNVAQSPTQGAQSARIYYCPMHPRYTSGRHGECPVCGMDLVKKESQASKESAGVVGDHAAAQLSGYQQQLLGAKLAPVVEKPFVKAIRVYGYVMNDMDLYKAQLRYIEAWREYALSRRSRLVKDEFPDDWGAGSGAQRGFPQVPRVDHPQRVAVYAGLRRVVVETKTGMESDGMVEVKEGLTEGEMVVAGSNFLVDAESRLRAAFPGMTATGKLP